MCIYVYSICVCMNFNESYNIGSRSSRWTYDTTFHGRAWYRGWEPYEGWKGSFLDRYISLFFGFTCHRRLITINCAILYRDVFFRWHVARYVPVWYRVFEYTRSAKAPHARKGRSLRLTGSLFNTSCKLIVSASILMLFLRKVPISSYAVRVETWRSARFLFQVRMMSKKVKSFALFTITVTWLYFQKWKKKEV